MEAMAVAERSGEIAAMTPIQREVEARTLFAVMDGLELQWIADPRIDLGAMFRPVFESTVARWRAGS